MSRLRFMLALAAAAMALSACGERSQELGAKHVKSDKPAFSGGDAQFTAAGWNAGDRAAWEQQIRTRGQGQNEYSRSAPTAPRP
ncbi:hypothetical protein [Azohydromonas lata]|uniref:hypothetical protein n=1 Tax=Azohydromonas lata TaxID=45677 RepID=UPI0027D7A888|nr:hypothetical protein [Azohydromonas lata]